MPQLYGFPVNKKLITEFSRFTKRRLFVRLVESARLNLRVRPGGLKLNDVSLARASAHAKKLTGAELLLREIFLDREANEIRSTLKIPLYLHQLVMAYILLGDDYAEYPYYPGFDFGCELVLEKDNTVMIKIYPGAKQQDIIGFVRRYYPMIVDGQSIWFEKNRNPYANQIRTRRKEKRDEIVYSFYERGIISYSGKLDRKQLASAQKFVFRLSQLDPVFVGLNPETIRKIIQNEKRRRK